MKKESQFTPFVEKTHFWGSIFSVLAIIVLVSVPVSIMFYLNVRPEISDVLKGFWGVALIFWPTALIEICFYTPMMGAGATYLSFVSGNIANLKLPCALNAKNIVKPKKGTDEEEVVNTIAVATSAIVCTVVIAAGVLLLSPILPKITAEGSVFGPAFNQVIPALFGALLGGYLVQYWKLSILPIAAATLIVILAPTIGTGALIPICVILSIVGALLMYNNGLLTGGVKPENPLKGLVKKDK